MEAKTQPFQNWDTVVRGWGEIADASRSARIPWPIHLTVVRHGETTNNAQHLITGATDPPLTEHGVEQASALRAHLAGSYDAAFHSGLRRSRETLDAAIDRRDLGIVLPDSRLAERSMGVLEGEPSRPLPAYDRGDLTWAPQGGETYESVARRVASFLLDLLAVGATAGRSVSVLAAAHVGTMRILSGILERTQDPVAVLTRQFGNADPIRFNFRSVSFPAFLDRWRVSS